MVISEKFRRAQSQTFQDKIIEIYPEEKSSGSLGTPQSQPGDTAVWCGKVNFHIITNELQAQEYGLQLGKDATVTSSDSIPAEVGQYIKYSCDFYRITEIIPRDAYTKLLCKKVK